ncbi:putative acetyl-coA carboxylase protein [Cryptosporidium serpentis]
MTQDVYDSVEDFVFQNGGTNIINRILVATSGQAAIKCIRSMRHWAYVTFGNEKAFEFVVMAPPEDIESNTECINEADYYVDVPMGPNYHNYANIEVIVSIAEEYECNAVWPGWGHASENPQLPAALKRARRKIIWIGPQVESMETVGHKIESNIIAQSVHVPCVPWSGDGITVDIDCNGKLIRSVSADKTLAACVKNLKECIDVCNRIGFPVMIKASAGGGGKGIRLCNGLEDIESNYRQVVNEVKGSPVFIMRAVTKCRHLEVQIIGDIYGDVMALSTRDCTIQRRHQKVIEEGPVVTVPKATVDDIEKSAERMCRAVGYSCAGTVEFLYDLEHKSVAFLEVNARLQVEHVISEGVTNCNLPAAQLQIAMGIPLKKIRDVEEYRKLKEQNKTPPRHMMAARVTSEHAEKGFTPTCGDIFEISFRSSQTVWGYFSVASPGNIHQYADSQFGHIFAFGMNREEARKNLIMGLKGLTIRGEIRTNVETLSRILENHDFINCSTYTQWLENSIYFSSPLCKKVSTQHLVAVFAAASYTGISFFKDSEKRFIRALEQGQLPGPIYVQHDMTLVHKGTKFICESHYIGSNHVRIVMNGSSVIAKIRNIYPDTMQNGRDSCYLISGGFDGRNRRVFFKKDAEDNMLVTFDGATYTFVKEQDPRQVRAPVSGKLVRWLIPNGELGEKGQPYAEVEIMKTYMQVTLSNTGKLEHAKSQGTTFNIGDILALLELPSGFEPPTLGIYPLPFPQSQNIKVPKLAFETFCSGGFRGKPRSFALANFREGQQQLLNVLSGYYPSYIDVASALEMFYHVLDPAIPFIEIQEACEVAAPLIPVYIKSQILFLIENTFKLLESVSDKRWYKAFELEKSTSNLCYNSEKLSDYNSEMYKYSICKLDTSTDSQSTKQDKTPISSSPSIATEFEEVTSSPLSSDESLKYQDTPDEQSELFEDDKILLSLQKLRKKALKASSKTELESLCMESLRLINEIIEQAIHEADNGESNSVDSYVTTRSQYEPLLYIIRRNEKGRWMRLMYELHDILVRYTEIEKQFEKRSSLISARIIPSMRTEYDLQTLMEMGRSHQQLKVKNEILEVIAQEMVNNHDLLQCTAPFHDTIHQIAELTSVEYTRIVGAYRHVLLMKENTTMMSQVNLVAMKIYDFLQCRIQSNVYTHLTSISNTPSSPLQLNLSTPNPCWGCSSNNTNLGSGSTNILMTISNLVADYSNFPDFALLSCWGHENPEISKLACEIYIRRHYERCGLSFYFVKSYGETWSKSLDSSGTQNNNSHILNSTCSTPSESPTSINQVYNRILAVWTHHALLTSSFLQNHCDILRSASTIPQEITRPSSNLEIEGDMGKCERKPNSKVLKQFNSSSTTNMYLTNSEGLKDSSRWQCMLNAFSGTNSSNVADELIEESSHMQTTIGLYFESIEELNKNFANCIDELYLLHNFFPHIPSSVDSYILLIVLSKSPNPETYIQDNEIKDEEDIARAQTSNDPSLKLESILNKHQPRLLKNNIYMVSFVIFPLIENNSSESLSASLVSPNSPSYYHFRSLIAIPHKLQNLDRKIIDTNENESIIRDGYVEEKYIRNVCSTLLSTLELRRLRYFTVTPIPSSLPGINLYVAVPCEIIKPMNKNLIVSSKDIDLKSGNQTNSISLPLDKKPSSPKASGNKSKSTSITGLTSIPISNLVSSSGSNEVLKSQKDPRIHNIASTVTSSISKSHRYFIRVVVEHECSENYFSEQERYFIAALSTLESWLSYDQNYTFSASSNTSRLSAAAGLHHMLFTSIGILSNKNSGFITTSMSEDAVRTLVQRYLQRIQQTSLKTIEFRYIQRSVYSKDSNNVIVPVRFVVDNPTGQAIRLRSFFEVKNPITGGKKIFTAINSKQSFVNILSLNNSNTSILSTCQNNKIDGNALNSKNYSLPSSRCQITLSSPHLQYENGYDGKPLDVPHPLIGKIDQKRAQAADLNTVYIYDFLDLLEEAIKSLWKKCPKYFVTAPLENTLTNNSVELKSNSNSLYCDGTNDTKSKHRTTAFLPDKILEWIELDLNCETGELEYVKREPGCNTCGMVAWFLTMHTPEYPKGRRVILIGNDITHQMGTFGIQEDLLFQRASEYARSLGIPRIFIAANSGARMGLATEVQKCLRVEFIDPEHPIKGYKYIYVTEEDYIKYNLENSIYAEIIDHPQDGKIYKIKDVVGAQTGLGVENLCGSGGIAGETSKAAKSIFTITYVTSRTVGIGAYLARLGHRVIQKAHGAPIVLTGYQALNKMVAKDIYSSNDELGGTEVMAKNGVTHLVVKDDLDGCYELLKWLSYVPECFGGRLPIMVDPTDPIYRNITYNCNSNTDDPRLMLTGCMDSKGRWLSGLCDRGSFQEVMSDWAKSVIVGRGRIGGIPVGFILVETRVTEFVQPADPVMPHTSELRIVRPGQIWFPDSAYKTAQAIRDFNIEELPLIIIANWRGFSGGQKDMFDAILKYGSFVVDELVNYHQPCFIYIPPKGELRGGAWVVLDSNVNPEFIEMYADPTARGGVLEATGIVEIRFRHKALKEWMMRLDPQLLSLQEKDKQLHLKGYPIDSVERSSIKEKISKRCSFLLPVYHAAAVHFADLHDTANRMKAKHAIRDIVSWRSARIFFIHRIKRQLLVFSLRNEISQKLGISLIDAQNIVFQWAIDDGIDPNNDTQLIQWICHSASLIEDKISQLS